MTVMQDNYENKRKKIRVDFNTTIILRTEKSEIHINGSSKDISVNGIFIDTKEAITVGSKCDLEIILSGTIEPIHLNVSGEVVRKQDYGIAVIFNSMDLDSYTHLKNIVKYNSSNPGMV